MTTQMKGLRIQAPVALPTISLCMIVKNEAECLPACLASAAGLVDEVIVYDTGSADDSQELARAAGAIVSTITWRGDFAAARNHSLLHASKDWILVLDADEVLQLPPDGIRRLKEFLRDGDLAIYSLQVDNDMGHGVTITHVTPRLFPNRMGVAYQGTIHETPTHPTLPMRILDGVRIAHSGYRPEVMAAKGKQARNVDLIGAAVAKDPHNPQLRLYLGTVHQEAGALGLAVEQYRQALYLCALWPEAEGVRQQAAANLVTCLGRLDQFEQAGLEAKAALRVGPIQHPGFWVALGNNENHLDQYEGALAAFHLALAFKDNREAQQVDQGCVTWMPWAGMGLACARMGRPQEALLHLEYALTWDLGRYSEQVQAVLDDVRSSL